MEQKKYMRGGERKKKHRRREKKKNESTNTEKGMEGERYGKRK